MVDDLEAEVAQLRKQPFHPSNSDIIKFKITGLPGSLQSSASLQG
jgi:hypothetical protein